MADFLLLILLYRIFFFLFFFFFNDTANTEIYTLSLHDALPISMGGRSRDRRRGRELRAGDGGEATGARAGRGTPAVALRGNAPALDGPSGGRPRGRRAHAGLGPRRRPPGGTGGAGRPPDPGPHRGRLHWTPGGSVGAGPPRVRRGGAGPPGHGAPGAHDPAAAHRGPGEGAAILPAAPGAPRRDRGGPRRPPGAFDGNVG